MDPESRVRKKNSRILDEICQKDPENFLQRPHNKYISNASHHRSRNTTRTAFGHSKMPKTPMSWSYNQIQHTCQRNTTRHGQRRQKTRKTTKNVHGQHSRVDRSGATGIMRCCSQPSQMEKDLCGSLQARTPTIKG